MVRSYPAILVNISVYQEVSQNVPPVIVTNVPLIHTNQQICTLGHYVPHVLNFILPIILAVPYAYRSLHPYQPPIHHLLPYFCLLPLQPQRLAIDLPQVIPFLR